MAGRLDELIHSATNSPALAVEEPLLKAIKALVRASDENVKAAAKLLMDRLGKNHSQVRYLSLLIIDELFRRSKLFRSELVSVFENFLLLTLGYHANQPLPPPSDRAAILKSKALEIIETWNDMFGSHYKQLRLGYEYLKDTLRMKFPGLREAATRAQEERNARERRTQDLLRCRLLQLTENFTGLKNDILSTIDQIEECFAILKDRKDEDEDEQFAPEAEVEDFEVYGIRSLRYTREEEMPPEESSDNAAIFDIVRDLVKLVVTRHLPATQEWLSVLMRVDPEDRQSRDALMKEVIDLRNRLVILKGRCEELGIDMTGKAEDDVEWEDEQVVDRTKLAAQQKPEQEDSQTPAVTTSTSTTSTTSTTANSDLKEKLLKEAPVLSWGSFLDGWGSEAAVPANTRGLVLDNHWGRVDPDAFIPSEKMAEMQVRASYYQPQKSEIRPCLAPLRNGGLCQRRDLRRCPLHGPVIPRDDQGNPLDQKDEASSSSKGMLYNPAELAAQAVKNVRDKDQADRTKKKLLRQSQTRMDREHNESVLRTAALAHSSEVLGEPDSFAEVPKKRKGSLTAMLHKKPTAKDRISKRLLTGRATDTTTATLVRDEDAKYRESFPNQW